MRANPVAIVMALMNAVCSYGACTAPDQRQFGIAIAGAVFFWLMATTDALDDNRLCKGQDK